MKNLMKKETTVGISERKKLTKKGNMMRLKEKEIDIGQSLYEVLNLWRSSQLTDMKWELISFHNF